MSTVVSVENLSKSYRLGQIGTGTFTQDLNVWWAQIRGKSNPMLKIGEKDYGNREGKEIWALKDVSFKVEQGEVLGIIGRNGAGKSTLLKILSRVTAPTLGKVKVKGRIASLLEVGTGFHPELTGRENIYLNGSILGMGRREIDRKFDEIVDFAEVKEFIDTPVKRYSSGMYVRLAFAVAAHLDPEILVVDEVLAVGDFEFQKKCLGKMSDVAQEGRTVLFVSHNMTAIQRLCSKCNLIDSGESIFQGNTPDVLQYYFDIYSSTNISGKSSFNYGEYVVAVRLLNENGENIRTWKYGEKLSIEVVIDANIPIYQPAVDVAFYNGTLRLFALQSDLSGKTPDQIQGRSKIIFSIENPGFIGPEMHFDVGIRQGKSSYIVLIREAGWLSTDHNLSSDTTLTNSMLYLKTTNTWVL